MKKEDAARAEARERNSYTRGDGTTLPRAGNQTKKTREPLPDSSYQNYLFSRAGRGEVPAWSDTPQGRFAIRMISRGIFGAAFFTIGGRMAQQQLRGYHPTTWKFEWGKPLQAIAKGFDFTLGRAIQSSVTTLAKFSHDAATAEDIGRKAVTFRTTRTYKDGTGALGRSYGAEIIGFTFDFAMASVGDASARNIIQELDPNIKKSWLVNDDGKPAAKGERAHIDWSKMGSAISRATWRIISKNQGEDWGAAIPYAFQMKFQRQFLSNVFKKQFSGHDIVFDQGWNGGAYKVDSAGKIIGDYQLVGALDLHARFVGYNVYTLMYREMHDAIGNAFTRWKQDGFRVHFSLPTDPIGSVIEGMENALRYTVKSTIKANMYMNPATIPFWLIRVPQAKWRASNFIEHEKHAKLEPEIYQSNPGFNPYSGAHYKTFRNTTWLDKAEKGFSQALNPIGKVNDAIGKVAQHHFENAVMAWQPKGRMHEFIADTKGDLRRGARVLAREFTDASLSYTPYMWAKAECGLLVDDSKGNGQLGEMDKAIYSFMDNVCTLNLRGAAHSLGKMWKLGTHFEQEAIVREGHEIKRIRPEDIQKQSPSPESRTSAEIPSTKIHQVQSSHRTHDRRNPLPQVERTVELSANDNAASANDNTADTAAQNDKNWVASVMGQQYDPSRVHHAGPTRH